MPAGQPHFYLVNLRGKTVSYMPRQLISFKIIELNRVSKFFHIIFRIDVKLNFDLKFWSKILSKAPKKFDGKILKNARLIS